MWKLLVRSSQPDADALSPTLGIGNFLFNKTFSRRMRDEMRTHKHTQGHTGSLRFLSLSLSYIRPRSFSTLTLTFFLVDFFSLPHRLFIRNFRPCISFLSLEVE